MASVTVADGVDLAYTAIGDGDPVVLVHGAFMNRHLWERQLAVLAEQYRVIAPDLRGHGESDNQDGTCRVFDRSGHFPFLEETATFNEALLNALD